MLADLIKAIFVFDLALQFASLPTLLPEAHLPTHLTIHLAMMIGYAGSN